jgi:dihydrofolate reductase
LQGGSALHGLSVSVVIQAPGGPEEDSSGGLRFGGWQVPYADDAVGQAVQDLFSQPFGLLLGRRTYDIWAVYWPRIGVDSPSHSIAGPFNRVRKHVATHRPDTVV